MDQIENNAVAQNAPETTGQANSPQAEAQPIEVQTPQGQINPEGVSDEIPTSDEEQRKAFQEMRLELKRLKEEKEVRPRAESAFSAFRQPSVQNVSLAGSPIRVDDYVDQLTGEVNRPAYNAAVQAEAARQAAYQAQASVQDQMDEFQARQKHPELFKDSDVEEEIAAKWLWHKTRGENITISEIADRYAKRYQKAVTKAEQIGAVKALEQVTPKEQAALSATSQSSTQTNSGPSSDLILGTRRGSAEAIAERLKGVPWANR